MDAFLPGWGFFLVPEGEAERPIQGGPVGTVGAGEHCDKAAGLDEGVSYILFLEGRVALVEPLRLFDDGGGGGDLGLDLAGLARRQRGVQAGANGGQDPVEFDLETLAVAPRPASVGRLRLP